MQKMYRQCRFEQKLEGAIRCDMKHDHQLGSARRNALGEEPHNHNRNHRYIVEAGEDANELPKTIGGKLQQRGHDQGENGDRQSHSLCRPQQRLVGDVLAHPRLIHVDTK